MDRRRLLFLTTAAGVGAALVLFARPGGSGVDQPAGAPAPAPPPAGAPAPVPPPGGTPPAGTPPAGLPDPTARTASPVPVVEDGGVAGSERLDPAEVPDAVRAAERFAAAWADPGPGWYARVSELATPRLAAALAGADPPQPAPELTGAGRARHDAPRWARVGVPAVRGTLVLDVVATGDRWLVSAVDWEPA